MSFFLKKAGLQDCHPTDGVWKSQATTLHIPFCFPLECEGLVQFERFCLAFVLGEISATEGGKWLRDLGQLRACIFGPEILMFAGTFCRSLY